MSPCFGSVMSGQQAADLLRQAAAVLEAGTTQDKSTSQPTCTSRPSTPGPSSGPSTGTGSEVKKLFATYKTGTRGTKRMKLAHTAGSTWTHRTFCVPFADQVNRMWTLT